MSRRSKVKHPNLKKNYILRNRKEYTDYDYVDTLSEQDKAYLDKFSGEFYGASFKRDKKSGKYKGNLHKTKSQKKECYDANNARNRCDYSRAKTFEMLRPIENTIQSIEMNRSTNPEEPENTLILNNLKTQLDNADYFDAVAIIDDLDLPVDFMKKENWESQEIFIKVNKVPMTFKEFVIETVLKLVSSKFV